MLIRRTAVFTLTSTYLPMVLVVCLGVPAAVPVFAAADPSDTESVTRGAQLYELYCSDCHGGDASERYGGLYDSGELEVSEDYAELIEIVRGVKVPEPAVESSEDWPEWAEFPEPEAERDMRDEVLGTVSSAITRFNEESLESESSENWDGDFDAGSADQFDPAPGATNLADPTAYFYGTSEEDMFTSIAEGTGAAMPPFRSELGSDEAIWDLVAYIRSLWGEEWRY